MLQTFMGNVCLESMSMKLFSKNTFTMTIYLTHFAFESWLIGKIEPTLWSLKLPQIEQSQFVQCTMQLNQNKNVLIPSRQPLFTRAFSVLHDILGAIQIIRDIFWHFFDPPSPLWHLSFFNNYFLRLLGTELW